jgi:hypothetical protein
VNPRLSDVGGIAFAKNVLAFRHLLTPGGISVLYVAGKPLEIRFGKKLIRVSAEDWNSIMSFGKVPKS